MQQLPLPDILTVEAAGTVRMNSLVRCLGLVQQLKRVFTKTGEIMQFFQLGDATRQIEVVLFPKALQHLKTVLADGQCILVKGKISKRNGDIKIIAEDITPWPDEFLFLYFPPEMKRSALTAAKQLLQDHPGSVPVYIAAKGKLIKATFSVDSTVIQPLIEQLGQDHVVLV
jgi:DNA polymerase-3 subunit alpha